MIDNFTNHVSQVEQELQDAINKHFRHTDRPDFVSDLQKKMQPICAHLDKKTLTHYDVSKLNAAAIASQIVFVYLNKCANSMLNWPSFNPRRAFTNWVPRSIDALWLLLLGTKRQINELSSEKNLTPAELSDLCGIFAERLGSSSNSAANPGHDCDKFQSVFRSVLTLFPSLKENVEASAAWQQLPGDRKKLATERLTSICSIDQKGL